MVHSSHQPRQNPARGIRPRHTAELLRRGQVEEEVCFDEGSGRPVAEDEFFVCVCGDEFVGELAVEIGIDGYGFFVGGGEDDCEGNFLDVGFGALFGEAFRPNYFGIRVLLMPWAEEDVVL